MNVVLERSRVWILGGWTGSGNGNMRHIQTKLGIAAAAMGAALSMTSAAHAALIEP